MLTVKQHLWFEKDMEAALELYVSLIPGSKIEERSAIAADNPSGPSGSVKVASFTLGDQSYMAIEAGKHEPFNDAFSILVECDTQEEIDRLWAALTANGGCPVQCGWLKDPWGVSWQISSTRLHALMNSPDAAAAQRAAAAMLKMVKIDFAAIEAAAKGE